MQTWCRFIEIVGWKSCDIIVLINQWLGEFTWVPLRSSQFSTQDQRGINDDIFNINQSWASDNCLVDNVTRENTIIVRNLGVKIKYSHCSQPRSENTIIVRNLGVKIQSLLFATTEWKYNHCSQPRSENTIIICNLGVKIQSLFATSEWKYSHCLQPRSENMIIVCNLGVEMEFTFSE